MAFVARLNMPDGRPPVRAYLHEAGLMSAYGTNYEPLREAEEYLKQVLIKYKHDFRKHDFLLAAIWGSEKVQLIDFFGFSGINENWKANPDVKMWVIKNGLYLPEASTYGDSIIVFGREEAFRRTTNNLSDYMANLPDLGEMEPPKTDTITRPKYYLQS